MAWVKLDDGFTDHPKIDGLSDQAFRLHVSGLCFCGRTMSDGFIPNDRVRRLLAKVTKKTVDELVAAGVWLQRDNGFEVKDFLLYNPSKEKVQAEREAAAERKRRWLEKQPQERRPNAVPNGKRTPNGTLPRPDPARPEGSRAGVSVQPPVLEGSPAPSGGDPKPDSSLPKEQVQINVGSVRAAKSRLRGVPA